MEDQVYMFFLTVLIRTSREKAATMLVGFSRGLLLRTMGSHKQFEQNSFSYFQSI